MNVLLGITGGIAAYKSCVLLRLFQKSGHPVRVIMTENAQSFVTDKTFEGLADNQVFTENWLTQTRGNAHIDLARWADVFIIAPATANTLYKCSHGKADDLLSTVYLAFDKKVFWAPAMNSKMLDQPSVVDNIRRLSKKGDVILDPASGELACKEVGPGKMMEPEDIFHTVTHTQATDPLYKKNIVITAGPTREYLDPVRFLSSPSTGKMGVAIAQEARRRGAHVTLIHGPMSQTFDGNTVAVTSAQQMKEAVFEHLPCDVFISSAAVSDYQSANIADEKIKKSEDAFTPTLTRTPDILAEVTRTQKSSINIGFAAETHHVVEHAKDKMNHKNLDMIIANQVHKSEQGFAQDQNTFHLIASDQVQTFQDISKSTMASILLDELENLL